MSIQTTQVRCPFCNGAQASNGLGRYTCDYCLQPFTAVDAQREESRLLEQVQGWLQQKIGALSAAGGAGVDASSRAFIFQQKVFPELRRDVDRALEGLSGSNQHPLVIPPLPNHANGPNPLLAARGLMSALKELRVRVGSEAVSLFAQSEADQKAIAELDERVGQTLNFFHATSSGHAETEAGYAAARRSLELMIDDAASSARRSVGEAKREYLEVQRLRFSALCELCRVFEIVSGESPVSGLSLAPQLDRLGETLEALAPRLEACSWNPSDTMPTLVAVRAEAEGARTLARWLLAYDAFVAHRALPFFEFRAEAERQLGALGVHVGEAVGPWTEALRAARGELAVSALVDFEWSNAWAEAQRARKTLGLFGNAETLSKLEHAFVPTWLFEVAHSVSAGSFFVSGGEARSLAFVNACNPRAAAVLIVNANDAAFAQLADHGLGGREVALPRSSPTVAAGAIEQAVRARRDLLNAKLKLKGLVYLPAAFAHFTSKNGERIVASCLAGRLAIDDAAREQLEATRELLHSSQS